jgi:hypothetical protein
VPWGCAWCLVTLAVAVFAAYIVVIAVVLL